MEESSNSDMANSHLSLFKNRGKDANEMRRKRMEDSIALRKTKRDDQLFTKRNISSASVVENTATCTSSSYHSMKSIIQDLDSDQRFMFDKYGAVEALRLFKTMDKQFAVDRVVEAGLVTSLVKIISIKNCGLVIHEATSAIANITAGTTSQTQSVVDAGGIPALARLISNVNHGICHQAICAIGNIAGDNTMHRDAIIQHEIIEHLIAPLFFGDLSKYGLDYLRKLAWTLSNLSRFQNTPLPVTAMKKMLPALQCLLQYDDCEVLSHTCRALCYLSDSPNERIELVLQAGVVPRLIQLLTCQDIGIMIQSLNALGNIVSGSDEQTQQVLNSGVLAPFPNLLRHPNSHVRMEAVWLISNITAGQESQIQEVVNAGLVPLLAEILQQSNTKAQIEAVRSISNYTKACSVQQLVYLVQCGVLRPLLDILPVMDILTILEILNVLQNLLWTAEEMGEKQKMCVMIEECGGLSKLDLLKTHNNQMVCKSVVNILEDFYSMEGMEEGPCYNIIC